MKRAASWALPFALVACGDAFTSAGVEVDGAAADVGAGDELAADSTASGDVVDASSDAASIDSAREASAADVVDAGAGDVAPDVVCPQVQPSSCGTGTVIPGAQVCVCGPNDCRVVMLMASCSCYTCACVEAEGNYCQLAYGLPHAVCSDVAGKGPRLSCTP